MHGSSTVSFLLLGLQLGVMLAMPTHHEQPQQMTANQQQQNGQEVAARQSQPELQQFQPDFDYSRFYFGNNNLGFYDKKSVQAPGFGVPNQWYGSSIPRQLAPKFKRDYNSYGVHDKRLDEQLFDDFYNNMKPSRYEWNFNRL